MLPRSEADRRRLRADAHLEPLGGARRQLRRIPSGTEVPVHEGDHVVVVEDSRAIIAYRLRSFVVDPMIALVALVDLKGDRRRRSALERVHAERRVTDPSSDGASLPTTSLAPTASRPDSGRAPVGVSALAEQRRRGPTERRGSPGAGSNDSSGERSRLDLSASGAVSSRRQRRSMDFNHMPEEESFEEVRSRLDKHRPREPPTGAPRLLSDDEEWRRSRLAQGASRGRVDRAVVAHRRRRARSHLDGEIIFNQESARQVSSGCNVLGAMTAGPAIMHWGREEQKQRHLQKILDGEEIWCEGLSVARIFDLASLQCRAGPDGDDFVVNGQKVWTTLAHRSDWTRLFVPHGRRSVEA